MMNFIVRIVLSVLVMVGCFSSTVYSMGGVKKLVRSYVKNAKSKVIVPINSHNMIALHEEKDQSNKNNIFKSFDPYWECPTIGTKYLKESIVTILYAKHQKKMIQNVVMTHYNNSDNAFSVHILGLRDYINHLNSEVNDGAFFDYAQFVIIFPVDGPGAMFTALDQLRCRKQSNELQELAKRTLCYKEIAVIERPYYIPFTGLSPIEVSAVLSNNDRFSSHWSVDTLCCPVGNTGLMTHQSPFINNTKE